MNRKQLVTEVANQTGYSQQTVRDVLNSTLDTITDSLQDREDVQLTGFGTFRTRHRAERPIPGPLGNGKTAPARHVPVFKAGKNLKDAVK